MRVQWVAYIDGERSPEVDMSACAIVPDHVSDGVIAQILQSEMKSLIKYEFTDAMLKAIRGLSSSGE